MNEPKKRGRMSNAEKAARAAMTYTPPGEDSVAIKDGSPSRLNAKHGILVPTQQAAPAKVQHEEDAIRRAVDVAGAALDASALVTPFIGKFTSKSFGCKPIEKGVSVQVYRDPFDVKLSQAYADRVWAGQSESVPRVERIRRVKLALEGQGLSFEGVEL
jgi:hypothetical protein